MSQIKFNTLYSATTMTIPMSNGNDLYWNPATEIGYLPSNGLDYDKDYWEKYVSYRKSPTALALNAARVKFVNRYITDRETLCDVGIGNGDFVEAMDCSGYDINPHAMQWLIDEGHYRDPYKEPFDVLTFWDVLEHIDEPEPLLKTQNIFVSIPIHKNLESLLLSKHLRPDEHIWHFTLTGFINVMTAYNYRVMEVNMMEVNCGREDIYSFYFKKPFGIPAPV